MGRGAYPCLSQPFSIIGLHLKWLCVSVSPGPNFASLGGIQMKKLIAAVFFAMVAGNAMAQAGGASSGAGAASGGGAAAATAGTVATVAAAVAGVAAASANNSNSANH